MRKKVGEINFFENGEEETFTVDGMPLSVRTDEERLALISRASKAQKWLAQVIEATVKEMAFGSRTTCETTH